MVPKIRLQELRGDFAILKTNDIKPNYSALASAIIYSIVETAKANDIKVYPYLEYLLTEIPKHIDGKDMSFIEDLLPWSSSLPASCRKNSKAAAK